MDTSQQQKRRFTFNMNEDVEKLIDSLPAGERTKSINAALREHLMDKEIEEQGKEFLEMINSIKRAEPVISSVKAVQMLRDGDDVKLANLRAIKR